MSKPVRTRFYNKLHSGEIEDYLVNNDAIFIPFGTVAAHGSFPLDVEETFADALALRMAEETDSLVFGALPFFYPGPAMTGRGTVQMSVQAGVKYLKELSYSLLNQGFRRQIYVTTSETGFLTASGAVVDLFDETKCPVAYMNAEHLIKVANANNPSLQIKHDRLTLDTMIYGAYKLLGREKELVIDPDAEDRTETCPDYGMNTGDYEPVLGSSLRPVGTVGFYYDQADDHFGPYGAVRSEQELEARAAEGIRLINDVVAALDLDRYMTSLRALDVTTNTTIKSKYGDILPKNRFGEWR